MEMSRRDFLERAAAWGGVALFAGPLAACGRTAPVARRRGERVVIVGAGLAGLSCAHRLRQHGVTARVYEARQDRVGGRCWTARGFAEGQVAEHGGEFIDSDHIRMRALVQELGLRLEDRVTYAKRRSGFYARYYLDGALRDEDAVFRGFGALQRRLRRADRRTGFSADGYSSRAARAFDRMTAEQWLDRNLPGGKESLLGRAAREYLADEFGLDPARLSATNLFYVIENPASEPAGGDGSDERFHVHGGNDQLPRGLAERLPAGALRLDAPLEALWRRSDGSYGLRFGGVRGDVLADRVILAIPFTTLRRVDLDGAGLDPLKRRCIEELGMGTNAKVLMQFTHRPEHYGHHWDGELITDQPLSDSWDSSLTQPGHCGLLTVYSGGAVGASYNAPGPHGPAPAAVVHETLASLERAVPGIARDFNGRAWLDDWVADPWARGSYAAFLPGQVTTFSSVIARSERGIHFAGEQTSVEFQGFLEGAVESGQRCAQEVLASGPLG
ncbi:MAG: FAD-dependent oxidoreductase [Solirubrobacterales bacterium]